MSNTYTHIGLARFEFLTVIMMIWVLWNMIPCWWVKCYLWLRGIYCLHLRDPLVQAHIPKIEAVCYCKNAS